MAHDPDRIPVTMSALWRVWKLYPDLRLGQLLVIAATMSPETDIFYVADDQLKEALRNMEKEALQTPDSSKKE